MESSHQTSADSGSALAPPVEENTRKRSSDSDSQGDADESRSNNKQARTDLIIPDDEQQNAVNLGVKISVEHDEDSTDDEEKVEDLHVSHGDLSAQNNSNSGHETDISLITDGSDSYRDFVYGTSEEEDIRTTELLADVSSIRRILSLTDSAVAKADDYDSIFRMLEDQEGNSNRVNQVINSLKNPNQPATVHTYVPAATGGEEAAPIDLNSDMEELLEIFPSVSQETITSLHELYGDRADWKELVSNQLVESLLNDSSSSPPSVSPSTPTGDGRQATGVGGDHNRATRDEPMDMDNEAGTSVDEWLGVDPESLITVASLFPECDPEFIRNRLQSMTGGHDGLEQLIDEMLDKGYPKQKRSSQQDNKVPINITTLEDIDEYLERVSNPEERYFSATGSSDALQRQSASQRLLYKEHALCQLYNDFSLVSVTTISAALKKQHNSYALTWMYLSNTRDADTRAVTHAKKLKYLKSKRTRRKMPDNVCETFYMELIYVQNRQKIQDQLAVKKAERAVKIEQARERGELITCPCCLDPDVLIEDMDACPDGHLFCRDCIRRSVEEALGLDKPVYPCLDDNCQEEFSHATLRRSLPSKTLSLCLRKMSAEAVRIANIENLVSCPFCDFSAIMDNPDDKLFRCLNPDCMRDSCRLCREPNHMPKRCNEIENSIEKDMRTYIEIKMNEAMIRQCHRCQRRFYKIEGCNIMTCVCGAMMCYLCRQPLVRYMHTCTYKSRIVGMTTLHKNEMRNAADEARKDYLRDHPEAAKISLTSDPKKLL